MATTSSPSRKGTVLLDTIKAQDKSETPQRIPLITGKLKHRIHSKEGEEQNACIINVCGYVKRIT